MTEEGRAHISSAAVKNFETPAKPDRNGIGEARKTGRLGSEGKFFLSLSFSLSLSAVAGDAHM